MNENNPCEYFGCTDPNALNYDATANIEDGSCDCGDNTAYIINKSRLLTFFDKKGNYNLEEWSSKLKKITKKDEPLIIICRSGRRSRIVANLLKEKELYSTIYHATNGIISWIDSEETTVRPNQNSFLK